MNIKIDITLKMKTSDVDDVMSSFEDWVTEHNEKISHVSVTYNKAEEDANEH